MLCRSILLLQMCIAGGLGIPWSARERTSSRNAFVSKAWLHMWFTTVSWINYRHLPIIKGQIHGWLKQYSSPRSPPSEHVKQLGSDRALSTRTRASARSGYIFAVRWATSYIWCCFFLDSVFVISRIIKVSAPAPLILTLIISAITKTSSDNCFLRAGKRDQIWNRFYGRSNRLAFLLLTLSSKYRTLCRRTTWFCVECCLFEFINFSGWCFHGVFDYLSCIRWSYHHMLQYCDFSAQRIWFQA